MVRIPLTWMVIGTIMMIAAAHFNIWPMNLFAGFLIGWGGCHSNKTLNLLYETHKSDHTHL